MPASIVTITVVLFIAVLVYVVYFLIQGAPFVRTNDENMQAMLSSVNPKKHHRIIDLGAGDGKLVMEFARHGFYAHGVELKPWLVWRAKKQINKEHLGRQASMKVGNLWKTDTSEYDVVLLFAITHVMGRLEKKLLAELKPGTIIVSNFFIFPNLKPSQEFGNIKIYKIK